MPFFFFCCVFFFNIGLRAGGLDGHNAADFLGSGLLAVSSGTLSWSAQSRSFTKFTALSSSETEQNCIVARLTRALAVNIQSAKPEAALIF